MKLISIINSIFFSFEGLLLLLLAIIVWFATSIFLTRKRGNKLINFQLFFFSLLLIIISFFLVSQGIRIQPKFTFVWFELDTPIKVTLGLDHLGTLLFALVIFVLLLVILYSTSYMKEDASYGRYFSCLLLFVVAMIGIVFSFNLLVTFIFWELVGFCSYLLINFWYSKPEAALAAKKAFIVNRVGDLGFVVGLGLIFAEYRTFEIHEIIKICNQDGPNETLLFWAGAGITVGCIGKSAQFPLLVWLPDAMQAPTPISALLHAATMVTAGVFLLARIFPLLHPELLTIIAYVGAITSILGAITAASQTDIKKILAYSTISQLGYMMTALGTHSYFASIFHLFTHAMFKACLFLCAGAIIHSMDHLKDFTLNRVSPIYFDSQDIRLMGGLRKKMPLTFIAFLLASIAGAGVPLSAGFLSKDEILAAVSSWAAIQTNPIHYILPILIYTTSLMTAFYLGRMFFLIFFKGFRLGKYYSDLKGYFILIHEAPRAMVISYLLLALFCIYIFFSSNPLDPDTSWLTHFLPYPTTVFTYEVDFLQKLAIEQKKIHYWIIALSMVVLSFGFGISYLLYGFKTRARKSFLMQPLRNSFLLNISKNGFYLNHIYSFLIVYPFQKAAFSVQRFDGHVIDSFIQSIGVVFVTISNLMTWIDKALIDGIVNGTMLILNTVAKQLKGLQNGKVQSYLIIAFAAIVLSFIWLLR